MEAAARLPAEHVAVRDLYALYPDHWIDVAAEQQQLHAAELLVWLHPLHWYGMPSLLKLWLDEVFAFGWAYGPGGQALRGKCLWLACSTGGPADSYRPEGYNRHDFADFLPPYTQTAALTQMQWLPPLVLHGAHRASDDDIAAHARTFAQRLAEWPARSPQTSAAEPGPCPVPADARPQAER